MEWSLALANIRIKSLPADATPNKTDILAVDSLTTRGVTIENAVKIGRPFATQALAEAGVDYTTAMNPLTTKQAIAAQGAVAFATAAQGVLANSAVQPGDLGTAATTDATDYATAAQGILADTMAGLTRAQAMAKAIPAGVTSIQTNGYATAGDGGAALYRPAVSDTEYVAFPDALKFTDVGGQKWVVAEQEIWAEMAGAKAGGGASANFAAIAACIDYLRLLGGGVVYLSSGSYEINNTIILPSRTQIIGQGSGATEIKLADGSNCDMVKSEDYDTLIGSNIYLIGNGNKYSLGLSYLRLFGNKANQSAGDGVKIYGKRVEVDDLIIADMYGEGWHSESNYTLGAGARNAAGLDMPEGSIDNLAIWGCGSNGFVFRGQHDTRIGSLFVGTCGGWGARFETSSVSPYYNGGCDLRFAHIYANDSGVYIASDMRVGHLITESNYKNGLEITTFLGQIGKVTAYANGRTEGAGYVNILLNNASYFSCPDIQIRTTGYDAGGLKVIGGSGNRVAATIYGDGNGGNTCAALETTAGRTSSIEAVIVGFNGAGARGAYLNSAVTSSEMNFDLTIENCTNGLHNGSNSARSNLRARIRRLSTQVGLESGSVSTSIWDVMERIDTAGTVTDGKSANTITSTAALNLNITTEQTVSLAHGLIKGPLASSCSARFQPASSNTVFVVQYFYVSATSATNVQVKFKLSTAAGTALTADLFIDAKL